jgi:CDP-4-dehydro-6-deoxyglucose reductase, E3
VKAVPIAKLADGREFPVSEDKSLLDAALAAGVVLPYSCRTGRCSSCKAKVVHGSTRAIFEEAGLTREESKEGWVLTCATTADSDVMLEAEDLAGVTLPVPKTLPCRISELELLAPDVIKVLLRLPPTAAFTFIPGQYIDVIGPNGIRRSYSLANARSDEKLLELHIRAVDGGAMSQYWFNHAKLNDLLRLNGPLGTFFVRPAANLDLIFLATGTGIAPVKSMLESLAWLPEDQAPRSVTVLWGGRSEKDLYLDLANSGAACAYIPVLSRPHDAWAGVRGHVQDVLLALAPDLQNAAVYACGSDAMIHSARTCLEDAGLPSKRFYSDAFVRSGTN